MNTQGNFFKNNQYKKNQHENYRLAALEQQRGKTSASPTRMPLLKDQKFRGFEIPISNYNIQNINFMDTDKLKDELIKAKNELNKKSKEFHALKISFIKLDEDNKRNIKLIEEVLEGSNTKRQEDKGTDLTKAYQNISLASISKLKESHIISSLKRQVHDYKLIIISKEEEISLLKTNSKVAKFHELDLKMKNLSEDFSALTERYNACKTSNTEKELKIKELQDEKEYYKVMMNRIKSQYDESKERVHELQDTNIKLADYKKSLEDRQHNSKFQQNSLKNQLRDKEAELIILKEQLKELESFKSEKEKTEKNLIQLNKNVQVLKEDNEKKVRRLKENEKVLNEIREKYEKLLSENEKTIKNSSASSALQVTQKDKDKKIKTLDEDNKNLKKEVENLKNEIKKLNDQLNNIKAQMKEVSEQGKFN
jgi:hypothetical protein